jgi:PhnB protein
MRKLGVFLLSVFVLLAALSVGRATAEKKATDDAETAIRAWYKTYEAAFNKKDVASIMSGYAPGNDLFVFDAVPPRQFVGWEAYKKDWEGLFAAFPGAIHDEVSDLHITVVGTAAYGHHIETGYFTDEKGKKVDVVVRVTDVYRNTSGKWLIVQEHVSFPVDIDSGKADLLSKP